MILFSSFTHVYVLLLFLYLGLTCGLIFFISSFLLHKLKIALLKPKNKKDIKSNSITTNTNNNDISCNNKNNNRSMNFESDLNNNIIISCSEKNNEKDIESFINNSFILNENDNHNNSIKQGIINSVNHSKFTESNDIGTIKKEIKNNQILKKLFYFVKLIFIKNNGNKTAVETIQKTEGNKHSNKKRNKNKLKTDNENTPKQTKQKFLFLKKIKVKLKIFLRKLVSKINKIKKPIVNMSFNIIKIGIIFALIIFSYLINLYLNFGEIRIIFILVFVASFFMAKSLLKLLANFLVNFYNYFRKKFQKER